MIQIRVMNKFIAILGVSFLVSVSSCSTDSGSKQGSPDVELLQGDIAELQAHQKNMDERMEMMNRRLDIMLSKMGGTEESGEVEEQLEKEIVPPDLKVERIGPKKKKKRKKARKKSVAQAAANQDEFRRLSESLGRIEVAKSTPKTIDSGPVQTKSDANKAGKGRALLSSDNSATGDADPSLSLYQSGFNAYVIDDCKVAEKKCVQFISSYPKHDYTDHAIYYLAECYEKNKDLPKAEKNYRKILKSYGKSERVPWALFRLGKLKRGKDPEASTRYFNELLSKYPRSDAAVKVKKELGVK